MKTEANVHLQVRETTQGEITPDNVNVNVHKGKMIGDINATERIAAVESSVCPRGYYKTELAQDRWESAAPWDAWALTSSGHAI